MTTPNFKRRRKIAALTCVVTIVLLVLNSRCTDSPPSPEPRTVTQKSECEPECDVAATAKVDARRRLASIPGTGADIPI